MDFALLSAATGELAVNPWVALAYLASGVLFILALRGLSSPSTSRAGNRYGMIGMTIAVVTTLITHEIASLPEVVRAAMGDWLTQAQTRSAALAEANALAATMTDN